jgi:hypothetical protein
MNIKEIAQGTLVATKIIPAEDVLIDVVNPDWDGSPHIYITSEPTAPEEQTQLGMVMLTTSMAIHVLAQTREQAKDIGHAAAKAVYSRFSRLEQKRGSGIHCILLMDSNVFQIPQRAEYQSTFTFRILHNP